MDLLAQSVKYGTMNTSDSPTMGYCDTKFASEDYTIQEETTRDGKSSTSRELIVKEKYLIYIREKKKRHW